MDRRSPIADTGQPKQGSGQHGFTLVELMVGVALLAILLAIATPAYQSVIASQSVSAAATALQSAISLARSEAIKRNRSVTLRPATDEAWSDGWLIANPTDASDDTAALHRERLTGRVVIEASGSDLQFNGSGRLAAGTARSFQIESATDENQQRCVTVGLDGRSASRSGGCS